MAIIRDDFILVLQERGYTPATVSEYRRCIGSLSEHMRQRRISMASLDEKDARTLAIQSKAPRQDYAPYVFKSFVRYLIDVGAIKAHPLTAAETARKQLKVEFEEYLRVQRGLSERTINHCWGFANRFLTFRFKSGSFDLSKITAANIAGFMQSLTSRGDKTPPTHLRAFFAFLFRTAKIRTNLAPSVPRMAQHYASSLPKYLPPEQVEALLAAIKGDTPACHRDYAMVLLQARLGLRAQEVIRIQLDDIDWRAGELLIRGKGGYHDRLPLPKDVGETLANYVRTDRRSECRALFVTDRAPRLAFNDSQILNHVLKRAFEKTGLTPPRRYIGSHVLRHSLATNMVRRGASLDEVADVLRHRARSSTMIYAKVDIDGLRTVAREWPVVAGGAK